MYLIVIVRSSATLLVGIPINFNGAKTFWKPYVISVGVEVNVNIDVYKTIKIILIIQNNIKI